MRFQEFEKHWRLYERASAERDAARVRVAELELEVDRLRRASELALVVMDHIVMDTPEDRDRHERFLKEFRALTRRSSA